MIRLIMPCPFGNPSFSSFSSYVSTSKQSDVQRCLSISFFRLMANFCFYAFDRDERKLEKSARPRRKSSSFAQRQAANGNRRRSNPTTILFFQLHNVTNPLTPTVSLSTYPSQSLAKHIRSKVKTTDDTKYTNDKRRSS
jgi:hypothetical protein